MEIFNKMVIQGAIPVIFLQEGDQVVAYTPALDFSSCGKNVEEARKRFSEALKIFVDELKAAGTLEEILQEYGWRKTSDGEGYWMPPQFLGHLEEAIYIPLGT